GRGAPASTTVRGRCRRTGRLRARRSARRSVREAPPAPPWGAGCSCALLHNGPETRPDAGETIANDAVGDAELIGGGLIGVALGRAQAEDVAVEGTEPGDLLQDAIGEVRADHLLLDVDRRGEGLVGGSRRVLSIPLLPA